MTLDASLKQVLELRSEQRLPPVSAISPAEARARLRAQIDTTDEANVGAVQNVEIAVATGHLGLRVYRPLADGPCPTVVYFHGGGWEVGDVDTSDFECRLLCYALAAVIVCVDYRRAPESPCPAAITDGLNALRWAADSIGELGQAPNQFAIAGESSGATIAAVVAQMRGEDTIALRAQLLFYPPTDLRRPSPLYPSRVEYGEGYFLTEAAMTWFADQYTSAEVRADNPICSPLLGDVAALPPTVLVTAEYDPLLDEIRAYRDLLLRSQVDVKYLHFDNMPHAFFTMTRQSTAANTATRSVLDAFAATIRNHF